MIAINCMGEMYNPIVPKPISQGASMRLPPNQRLDHSIMLPSATAGGAGPSLEDEMNLDKNTLETIKELYLKKDQAVSREDFDEAKRLKIAIDRIRAVSA